MSWRAARDVLLMTSVASLVFFTNLGAYTLFDEDEPKNAVCGREMFLRNDWVVPTFNQDLRTDKPILIYWIMQASYRLWGINEFGARFGSAVCAVGTCLLVGFIGRRFFDPRTGFLATVILATSLMYAAVGRSVTPDSCLIFSITLAFTAYLLSIANSLKDPRSVTSWRAYVPATFVSGLPFYLAMGLAVLAKGPVGVVLPSITVGLFVLLMRDRLEVQPAPSTKQAWWKRAVWSVARTFSPRRVWEAAWALRPVRGLTATAAVALPWYLVVGYATDGAWLTGFLGGHNVNRFLAPMENHSGPIVYYIPVVCAGFFPWSIFAWQTGRYCKLSFGESRDDSPALLFFVTWFGVWLGFFSLASTKLPNYVLPMYPAIAILTARYLAVWSRYVDSRELTSFRNSCRLLAGVGVLMAIGLSITAAILLPDDLWLGAIGAIPLVGGAIAYGCGCRRERGRAVFAMAATAIVLATTVTGFASVSVARNQNAAFFADAINRVGPEEGTRLATWQMFLPSLVFYADDRVEKLREPVDVAGFFAEDPAACVITRSDRLPALTESLPADVVILARQRRFLRRHDLVLLGRPKSGIVQANFEPLR
jgi:4-amino-4-deoxy-L-arabinose transferase-like glycosyltransferase